MKLEHSFTVPVPVEEAWRVLLDVPTVAPCMPGARLESYEGDDFTGTVKVKLGPINLTYRGQGRIVERDEANRRVVMEASGRESRGAGTAKATVTAVLRPDGDTTSVVVNTDLNITGRPAQFGRGMMADVGNKLIGQFAECLSHKLQGEGVLAGTAPAGYSAPGGGSPAVGQRATAGAGATPSAAPSAPAMAVPEAVDSRAEQEVEPIDLLDVTGAGAMMRQAGGYAVAFVAGLLLGWVLARRRS